MRNNRKIIIFLFCFLFCFLFSSCSLFALFGTTSNYANLMTPVLSDFLYTEKYYDGVASFFADPSAVPENWGAYVETQISSNPYNYYLSKKVDAVFSDTGEGVSVLSAQESGDSSVYSYSHVYSSVNGGWEELEEDNTVILCLELAQRISAELKLGSSKDLIGNIYPFDFSDGDVMDLKIIGLCDGSSKNQKNLAGDQLYAAVGNFAFVSNKKITSLPANGLVAYLKGNIKQNLGKSYSQKWIATIESSPDKVVFSVPEIEAASTATLGLSTSVSIKAFAITACFFSLVLFSLSLAALCHGSDHYVLSTIFGSIGYFASILVFRYLLLPFEGCTFSLETNLSLFWTSGLCLFLFSFSLVSGRHKKKLEYSRRRLVENETVFLDSVNIGGRP